MESRAIDFKRGFLALLLHDGVRTARPEHLHAPLFNNADTTTKYCIWEILLETFRPVGLRLRELKIAAAAAASVFVFSASVRCRSCAKRLSSRRVTSRYIDSLTDQIVKTFRGVETAWVGRELKTFQHHAFQLLSTTEPTQLILAFQQGRF